METESLLEAAHALSELVRTSLGPLSRDKMIVKQTGELLITNDGRTLLEETFRTRYMPEDEDSINTKQNPIHILMVNLSSNQDASCGDGTTSVVVLCGKMCKNAQELCAKGIHPLLIIDGYKQALAFAVKQLETMILPQTNMEKYHKQNLIRATRTSLNTKMVNADRERLAQLCVEAALLVTKFHENMKPDCDLRLIKLDYIDSGSLEETQLIRGITIMKKSFSHENMPTKIQNVKLAVLSCALEAPRPKTKHTVNINSEQDFIQLKIVQASFYEKICTSIKNSGANAVICQWGIDHEVNDWLVYNNIVAVRWVVGDDIERIAMATGATICPRISELTSDKLGTAETMYIQQVSYSDGSNSGIIIEGCSDPRTCSILVRGTNQYMCEDTVRSLHDALCSVRNSMIETEVIPGGGASETELFVQINDKFIPQFVDKLQDEQWNEFQRDRMYQLIDVFKSYAESLLVIPLTLAENAGVVPVQFIQKLVLGHRQKQEESKYLGIALTEATSENLFEQEDEELMSILDMRKTQVVEMLSVKKNILEAATETACIILKVDQVIK